MRVIVASANLTEDGYRRNQEIFGVMDYSLESTAPLNLLHDIIGFLDSAATFYGGGSETVKSPSIVRWTEFLEGVREATNSWGNSVQTGKKEPRIYAVLTGSERPSVFEQVANVWPENSPPSEAFVTSPFFDPPGIPNQPAMHLWDVLRKRGEATVTYNVIAEEIGDQESLFIHAPQEIMLAEPEREAASSNLCRLSSEDEDALQRPIHLKSIFFQGNDWIGHLIGSSNFTSRGLGIGNNPNLEANILYLVSRTGDPVTASQLISESPQGIAINEDNVLWQSESEMGEDDPDSSSIPLHPAFGTAVFSKQGDLGEIQFHFTKTPPKNWCIFSDPEQNEIFIVEKTWIGKGSPGTISLPWTKEMPPSGFEVAWQDSIGRAWWPVNIENAASLPPPEELKNLSLEMLIDILTSARPLYQVLKTWLKNKKMMMRGEQFKDPYDPHKRVDTSGFLLQKTYRVSTALNGLREKLQKPSTSEAALEWRLKGPVGVLEVARAITDEAKSQDEKAFLLTELALEIARVKPNCGPGCLSAEIIKENLNKIICEIKQQAFENIQEASSSMKKYIKRAFQEIKV